jgi:GxxExxY protein
MSSSNASALTYNILKCAKKVFAELGGGCDKQLYTEALYTEFSSAGYIHGVERAPQLPVFYKGNKLHHTANADFKIEYKGNTGLVYIVFLQEVTKPYQYTLKKLLTAVNCESAVILNFAKAEPDFSKVHAGVMRDKGKVMRDKVVAT